MDARLLLVDRRLFRGFKDGPHLLAGAQIIDDDLGRIAGLAEAIGPEDEEFIVLIEDLFGAVVERRIVAVAQRVVQLQFDLGLALGVEFQPKGTGRLLPHLRIRRRDLLARGQREHGMRSPAELGGGSHARRQMRVACHALRRLPMAHAGHS